MSRRSQRVRYGGAPHQFGVLSEPRSSAAARCVIVMVHGGFWRWPVNRWVMALLARDAVRRGYTVFNVEYRRLGRFGGGGGWPATFDDIVDAVELMATRFDDARIVLAGHSAGGHLALVAAARVPELVDGVVAMSAPTDLRLLAHRRSEPVRQLVAGAPSWSLTSPIEMVPTGVPTVCVHGEADTTVRPGMSIRYTEAATAAGDDARLMLVSGENHRAALLPTSRTWKAALASIDDWSGKGNKSSSNGPSLTMGVS